MSRSQAQVTLEKANKKANSSVGWFSSESTKWEEAGDLFQQAANAFKLDKMFLQAGDAFAREAECREKSKELNDAANAWWNAAKAYKQAQNIEMAVNALGQTVIFLTKTGRFRQAADREKEIAQLYQQDNNLGEACASLERAGDWYAQEDANAMANGCYKDAADLHAQIREYPQAIARYEQVADYSLSSALTKYSVRDYWLRALLCALANKDTVAARRNMATYIKKEPSFASAREGKFASELIDAVEAGDVPAFATACQAFNQVMALDAWKTDILLEIKKAIEDEEPGLT